MAGFNKRYYAWLIKAYFKRMKRTIISSAILGILIFFAIIGLLNYYFRPLIFKTSKNVGYAGTYTVQALPDKILGNISYGLTKVDRNGQIQPGAAYSWTIKDNKTYTFKLKKGIRFHNGEELTSKNINLNFSDVQTIPIDKYTIQYKLKNAYSPFLISVSRPIFGKSLSGLGQYQVSNIDLNGGYVRSITLTNTKSKEKKEKIYFYPTQRALKVAFMLGEVSSVFGVSSTIIDNTDLSKWKGVKTEDMTDYGSLISVFYNSSDSTLSNKKIRQALNYSLPATLPDGERAFGPIPPNSQYFSQPPSYKIADIDLAKTILKGVKDKPKNPIEISTTDEYEKVAEEVQNSWKKLGIESKIKIVNDIPSDFQAFIYKIKLPEDPDQYVLWHSDQVNNITHYKNLRIDKLLEDGRSVSDVEERKKIYADFQKYLTDDVPASFLFFPKEYNLYKQ